MIVIFINSMISLHKDQRVIRNLTDKEKTMLKDFLSEGSRTAIMARWSMDIGRDAKGSLESLI